MTALLAMQAGAHVSLGHQRLQVKAAGDGDTLRLHCGLFK